MTTNYKVYCADCQHGYEVGGRKPYCCGWCGSDFIAVKAINVADTLSRDDMPNGAYPPYDAAPATGMYDA